MLYVLALLLFIVIFFTMVGLLISGPVYKGPVTDHFNGTTFVNLDNVKAKGLSSVLRWMFNRKREPWKAVTTTQHGPKPASSVPNGVVITFINHSSFLVQADGMNILLDPVYSKRVSPFQWLGPKRMRPPGIRFEDLPKIDFVLISHNHYDHLDIPTVRKIRDVHHPRFVVPLGVKAQLLKEDITSVEIDWWEKTVLSQSFTVQSVPAQHFSGRGTLDRDKTLWCGYVIETPTKSIYFAGDSGYHASLFKMIGEKIGKIDVSIIPIGAFKPRWFMSPIHCSPDEAIQIHLDVNSKMSIASHFGTFPLADDSRDEPLLELKSGLEKRGISAGEFVALKEGTAFTLKS